jgi:hypothetical protein
MPRHIISALGGNAMKRSFLVMATILASCTAAAAAPAASAPPAPFGCGARATEVCYFRIFYARGDRIVVLPAGMKTKMPDVVVGRDQYCMALGKAPPVKCTRKVIGATNNT